MTSVSKQTGRLEMRDLIILTVLICLLFTFMLGNRPLSVPDEGRYVEIPREMVASGNYLTPRLNSVKYFEKPVFFYWLEAFSIKLFGLNEFTLRLWPALFALFGCLAVAVAGARLFGRRTGLLSAAVLATSLLYYGLSRAIILDMPVSILLTLGLLSFLMGIHEAPGLKRRLYLWGFYAFAALAVLTKGLIGIIIPGMVTGAWILLLGEWRMLKTLYIPSGLALFLLIAAPWHIMVGMANPEFYQFYFIHEHFQRFLTKVHGRYQPFWYFMPIVLLGLFPWSAFLVQAIKHSVPSTWRERHEHRDALFLMLWAGLVFLFFSASGSKLAPYILPVFPPLALLIGRYLAAAWDSRNFPGLRAGYAIVLIASLLLAAAFLGLPYYWPIPAEAQMLGVYRYTIAFTLAIGGAAAWVLMRYRGLGWAFIALAMTSALFLTQVNAAAPRVDTKSVKQLAVELKARLKSGNEVASYREYYQDLPVYLEQRITVVDWGGELNFGNSVEDTKAWMTDGDTFWKRWQGPATMYLLTPIEDYEALKQSSPDLPLFPIARNNRNIVLSNREVKP
ncbi:MAG: glycosyltransferase family 39 protein [Nitrospirae bacterium]|nr:glycosyltransferase family 39 protein [Nitrospirota bacterium]